MNNNKQSEVNEPSESYSGWIKLYRQITESKIWETKPSSWVVCWIYILLKVSFVNNNSHKKGEAHFRSVEYEALPFDVTNDIWYRCLKWLEDEGMIKRQKVWRGEVITVLNYEKYQNNLSSENCKTGLDPNHIKNIPTNIDEAEAVRQSETPKSYLNHIQIEPQTNIDGMQVQDTLKNIRSIRNKNKEINNIDSENLDSLTSLKDEKDLKDTLPLLSAPPSKDESEEPDDSELENKIAQFYGIFKEVMEMDKPYGVGYRVYYRSDVEILMQHYTLDDIKKALGKLKKKTQKEHPRDWRGFINPKALVKQIDNLLIEEKETQIKADGRFYV